LSLRFCREHVKVGLGGTRFGLPRGVRLEPTASSHQSLPGRTLHCAGPTAMTLPTARPVCLQGPTSLLPYISGLAGPSSGTTAKRREAARSRFPFMRGS
jgi:hypothetical protein